MNWKNFLQSRGAEFKDDKFIDFGAPNQEAQLVSSATTITPLLNHAILRFSGADVREFLANMLSNDINKVTATTAQYSSWCTHQGRVIATLFLFEYQGLIHALVADDLALELLDKFKMFVLRSNVNIEVMDSLFAMEIYGEDANKYLKYLSENNYQQFNQEQLVVVRIPGLKPRGLIIGTNKPLQKLWQELDVNCAPVGVNAWNLINIRSGIPHVSKQISQVFLPHMLNMPQIPMVDFKKGCYPGQEVVARMHYLGNNKHQMYRLKIDCDIKPAVGTKLISDDIKSSRGSGQIVQSALNQDANVEALAVLPLESVKNNNVFDQNDNQVTVTTIEY